MTNPIQWRALLAVAALAGAALPAHAHVTLAVREAKLGGSYMATLKVPHGCSGAATTAVTVRIPAGVYGVKPMPKPGWQLKVESGKYDAPFMNRGAAVTEGVTAVTWSGGNLPDAYYDEFVLSTSLADSLAAGKSIYFPVVQQCEGGKVDRWIEIPAAGKVADDYPTPAPGLMILPK